MATASLLFPPTLFRVYKIFAFTYALGVLAVLGWLLVTLASGIMVEHGGGGGCRGAAHVGGEPMSVAVYGNDAIVVVNTSEDYASTSGIFHVIDVPSQTVLRAGDLGGSPTLSVFPWTAVLLRLQLRLRTNVTRTWVMAHLLKCQRASLSLWTLPPRIRPTGP
jgi:hypothetical protein